MFLNAVGTSTYGILRSLLAPDSPRSKSLPEIIVKLRFHFEPKPSIIAERFKFHKRSQNPGESIATYIAELRCLAARCSFPRDYLDNTLRYFACGLRSKSTQKQLLAEKDLTLTSALEKAQSLETTHRNAEVLKGHTPSLPVGQVSDRSSSSRRPNTGQSGRGRSQDVRGGRNSPCYRRGGKGHVAPDCTFRDAVCHSCGKVGHLSKVCCSNRGRGSRNQQGSTCKSARVGTAQPDNETENDDLLCNVYTLGAGKIKPYTVVMELNGQPVSLEIDTGAAVSIISEKAQKKLFPTAALDRADVRLSTYTTKPIPVLGQMSVIVRYKGYEGQHTPCVVKVSGPALLGREWLSKIKLAWASISLWPALRTSLSWLSSLTSILRSSSLALAQ